MPRQRKKTVATIVTRFQAGAGGVALRGALALDPDRYEVTIIAGSGDRLLKMAGDAGLRVIVVPALVPEISPRHDLMALRELTEHMRKTGYEVVHTHSAKAGAIGRLAAIRSGVPLVVHTFHGFPFHEFQPAAQRQAYMSIERWLGKRTDAFLAVGTGVAAQAVRAGLASPERIRTIGAAVDAVPLASRAGKLAARQALGARPGVRIVGTVGRLDYQKAPEHFVEAISRLDRQDVLAVWIGDGPYRSRVADQVDRLGLTNRFLLLGERTDVPSLLAGFDVFAMTSRYEGLPCALVEAMSAGVPVVATAVNAVPDVVAPGETGLLVAPERPEQVARAIGYLLDHPDDARRMAVTAAAQLGNRFDPRTLGAVLDDTYRSEPSRVSPSLNRTAA